MFLHKCLSLSISVLPHNIIYHYICACHTVEPPVITKHPLNKTAAEGKATAFSIKAQGTNLKYEWWSNETILKEDDHYSNVSTPHLSITNAGIMHSGQYYCVVSNEGGRATSNHAQLVISELCVWVNTFSILVT